MAVKKHFILILLLVFVNHFIGSDNLNNMPNNFIELDFFSDAHNAETHVEDILQQPVSNCIANKGALIEAIFILHNRKNNILDFLTKYRNILDEAISVINFSNDKDFLSSVYKNKYNNFHFCEDLKNDKSLKFCTSGYIILNTLLYNIAYDSNIEKAKTIVYYYPYFIDTISSFISFIESEITNLSSENAILYDELRKRVDYISKIQDIVEYQYELVQVYFDNYKNNLIIKKLNILLYTYEKQLQLLKIYNSSSYLIDKISFLLDFLTTYVFDVFDTIKLEEKKIKTYRQEITLLCNDNRLKFKPCLFHQINKA